MSEDVKSVEKQEEINERREAHLIRETVHSEGWKYILKRAKTIQEEWQGELIETITIGGDRSKIDALAARIVVMATVLGSASDIVTALTRQEEAERKERLDAQEEDDEDGESGSEG